MRALPVGRRVVREPCELIVSLAWFAERASLRARRTVPVVEEDRHGNPGDPGVVFVSGWVYSLGPPKPDAGCRYAASPVSRKGVVVLGNDLKKKRAKLLTWRVRAP